MKLDLATNSKRIVAAAAIGTILEMLFPFLNRTLFLWLLTPEYLGLNGLFGSILGVLRMTELGFGSAVVYFMFKPIAEDDREQVCAYLHFYQTIYRIIGTIIMIFGLLLMPFLPRLIHGSVPQELNLYTLYLLHITNTSFSYFFFAYRGSILYVHQRSDVTTNINTAISLLQYLAVFLVLFLTRNYYLYLITTITFTLASNILIFWFSRKLFPDIEPRGELATENRRQVVEQVKNICIHKLGGTITGFADNLVVSAFLGLTAVAAYGNYFYIANNVARIPSIIFRALGAGIGNRLQLDSPQQNFLLFMKIHRLVEMVILWCAAIMLALFIPFLELWTRHSPTLMRHCLLAILFVLYFYVQQSRNVVLSFKDAAGLWRKDRWKPLTAGVANLTLNIFFVLTFSKAYKLDGVILSTILTLAFIQIPWETHVLFTNLFTLSDCKVYLRSQACFALKAVFICALTWYLTALIPLDKLAGFLVKAFCALCCASTLTVLVCYREVTTLWLFYNKRTPIQ